MLAAAFRTAITPIQHRRRGGVRSFWDIVGLPIGQRPRCSDPRDVRCIYESVRASADAWAIAEVAYAEQRAALLAFVAGNPMNINNHVLVGI